MLLSMIQTVADSNSIWTDLFQVIFDIAAVIGLIVILLVIIGALSMIPDFFRYLKLKSM